MCKEAATNLFRIPVIYEEKDLRKEAAANLFSIPVIYIEKICMAWVQMRKYETCVGLHVDTSAYLSSGSAHAMQTFRIKYGK